MRLLSEILGLVLCGSGLFFLGWAEGKRRERKRYRNVSEWYRQQAEKESRRRQKTDLSVN
jgi:hypothetical protein